MLRALPAMIRTAASRSAAFKSGAFSLAISSSCARVTLPTLFEFGEAVRSQSPGTRIEILVPDFRGRHDLALEILDQSPPDVFNHNLETVPRLYKQVRPGADYTGSLSLLQRFKERHPQVPTKSGLMLGLGENFDEIEKVMSDLREHGVDMLTLGQYLQPSRHHLPVVKYVTPDEFVELGRKAKAMGFANVASGPMVRSSYHADLQAAGQEVS